MTTPSAVLTPPPRPEDELLVQMLSRTPIANYQACVARHPNPALLPAHPLERRIACYAARSDIESFCNREELDGAIWYDLDSSEPGLDRGFTENAAEYLGALGLLTRHPDRPRWVSMPPPDHDDCAASPADVEG